MSRIEWSVVAVLTLSIAAVIWFSATHRCVRSHPEQRMSCTTIHIGETISTTDCRPHTADVCDEWTRR